MAVRCPRCGAVVVDGSRVCASCQLALSDTAPLSDDLTERRLLTIVCPDIIGSTPLSQTLDPEDMGLLLDKYREECAKVIRRWDGHVAQYTGDGIWTYFGYPDTYEDDARRAVGAALEITRIVPSLQTPQGVAQLGVRVGVTSGVTVVSAVASGEKLAVGSVPNLAAHIQKVAPPNGVVISESTRSLVQGYYEFEPFEGSAASEGPLYRVVRATGAKRPIDAAATVGLTEFVGRAKELAALKALWARAIDGTTVSVLVQGEAGIGKSRLVHELKASVANGPAKVVEWHCAPGTQGTPLRPVAEALARQFGLADDDSGERRLHKVERALAGFGALSDDNVWLSASLLSVPTEKSPLPEGTAQSIRKRTLEMLLTTLGATSTLQPLLLVVEDLHWADPSTLELIGLALERLRTHQILFVLTSRPGFDPPWSQATKPEEMGLSRLTMPEAEAMVREVAGRRELPEEVLDELPPRSEGVPLFVEELTRAVIDTGVLVKRGDRYELARPLDEDAIPSSIQASITARIHRLGASKRVAQVGSVLGRSFTYEMIRAIDDASDADLQRDLAELVRSDFLQVTGEAPDSQWTFKHALIRDAAYDSWLRKKRRDLHKKIADTLTNRFPTIAKEQPEVLASHLEGAGLTADAVHHYELAGTLARSRAANREAIAHFRRALGLLAGLPEGEHLPTELRVQLGLAPALSSIKGWASVEVDAACRRARELCERLDVREPLLPALWMMWTVHFLRGNLVPALAVGEEVLAMARATQDPKLEVLGHHAVGFTRFYRGELFDARGHAENGIALFDIERERWIVETFQFSSTVALRVFLALSLWLIGEPAQAEVELAKAEELVLQLRHPPSTAFFLSFAGYLGYYGHDYARVRAVSERMLKISEDEGFLLWIAVATIYRGWSRAGLGEVDEGLAEMRHGLDLFRRTGTTLTMVHIDFGLAETLRRAGRRDEALFILAEAQAHAESKAERLLEPELYRLRAEILLERSGTDTEEAETSLRKAVSLARAQGARALERRAATTLAHLLGSQGKEAEARGVILELDDEEAQTTRSII